MDRRSFVAGASATALVGCVIPPKPEPAPRSFASPIVSIPFRIDYGRRLIVQGLVNDGGPLDFIVDTAATTSVLFENAMAPSEAERSGLPDINLLGLNGVQKAPTFRIGSIDVGGRRLENHIAPILRDWENFQRTPHGVLGLDFLGRTVMVIDPVTSKLELYDAPAEEIEALSQGWRSVPLQKEALGLPSPPFLLVDVVIRRKRTPFLVDTGSRSTLCNFPAVAHLQTIPQITAPNRNRATVSDIYSDEIEAFILRKYSIDLGVVRLPAQPILVAETQFFDEIGFRDMPFGVLGLDNLLQQAFAIDFSENRLFVRRTA